MPSFNEDLADEFISHRVDVLRFAEGAQDRVTGFLKLMEEDVTRQIREADIEGLTRSRRRQQRQNALLKQVRESIETRYEEAAGQFNSELREIASVTDEAATGIVNRTFGAELVNPVLTPQDLETLVEGSVIQGSPAEEWWEQQAMKTRMQFSQQVRLGVAQGETNDQIVRRIRGESTGRRRVIEINGKRRVIHEFRGGVMDATTRDARALVRTGVQHIANQTQDRTFRGNSDVLRGEQALVTLDGRTTLICISRSGFAWDFQGRPLPGTDTNEDFPGPPPWHYQCRTILVPVVKSWDELGDQLGSTRLKKLREAPKGTRASMDGQVAADLNYEQWLGKQVAKKGDDFGKDVLGAQRFRMWQEGKLSLKELTDQSGRVLSVAELRRRIQ